MQARRCIHACSICLIVWHPAPGSAAATVFHVDVSVRSDHARQEMHAARKACPCIPQLCSPQFLIRDLIIMMLNGCTLPVLSAASFLSQNNNFSGTFVSPLVRGSNLHIAHLGNNNFTVFALSGAHLSNLDLQFNEYANASLTQFTSLVSLESLDTQNDVYSVSVWVGGERDCSGHSRSHAQGHAPQERVVYL